MRESGGSSLLIVYINIVNETQTGAIRNVRKVSSKCAELRHARSRFAMSFTPFVCLSAFITSAATKRIYMNIDLGNFVENRREN
jgi:hypothetical protein